MTTLFSYPELIWAVKSEKSLSFGGRGLRRPKCATRMHVFQLFDVWSMPRGRSFYDFWTLKITSRRIKIKLVSHKCFTTNPDTYFQFLRLIPKFSCINFKIRFPQRGRFFWHKGSVTKGPPTREISHTDKIIIRYQQKSCSVVI